jgi:hypothetical protein
VPKVIVALILTVQVAVLATALSGCANLAGASSHLEQGMTEDQVKTLVGSPHSVSLETCGSKTPEPWTCKQYKYGGSEWVGGTLYVRFHQSADGLWRVNDWNHYDY